MLEGDLQLHCRCCLERAIHRQQITDARSHLRTTKLSLLSSRRGTIEDVSVSVVRPLPDRTLLGVPEQPNRLTAQARTKSLGNSRCTDNGAFVV